MIDNGLLLNREPRKSRWSWLLVLLALMSVATPLITPIRLVAQESDEEATDDEAASDESAKADSGNKAKATTDDAEAQAPKKEQTYLEWLWEASGYEGLLIGLMSVALLAFIVSNAMQLRLPIFVPPDFVQDFEAKVQSRDYQGAYDLAKADDSFVAKMLAGGLARLSRGNDEAQAGMQEVAEDENMSLDHRLSYISIIGATAPMLGLLGTVHGMVSAFSVIANSTVSPKPSDLAKGITLALVTTLEGLIVAIPAVVAFALFKNMQSRMVLESTMAAENMLSRFSQAGKRPSAGSSAPPSNPAS